jgi:hypothetical protein
MKGKLMETLYNHRYYSPVAVTLRTLTCLATIIWAIVVLLKTDALNGTTLGPSMTAYLHEDWYGIGFLALAGGLLWRLWKQSKPMPVLQIGYAIQTAAWGYIWILMLIRLFNGGHVRPAIFSLAMLGALISAFALWSAPRDRRQSGRQGERLPDYRRVTDANP